MSRYDTQVWKRAATATQRAAAIAVDRAGVAAARMRALRDVPDPVVHHGVIEGYAGSTDFDSAAVELTVALLTIAPHVRIDALRDRLARVGDHGAPREREAIETLLAII